MTDEPLIRWEWVVRNSPELLTRAGEHLVMTSIAVSVGFAVSLGLAILVRRRRRLRGALFATATWRTPFRASRSSRCSLP